MDTGFIDLDILVTRVRHAPSKRYFLDAVKAYKAGALRGSLTSAWVALAFDFIEKYRELSAAGDAAAADFVRQWDVATQANNITQLLRLEGSLLDHAADTTQIVDSIAKRHLVRLREDRHLCAHPAFSAEAKLFEPSPELVRLHLVNVIEFVLSREPRQGREIFEIFSDDVQSLGFPNEAGRVIDYVEQRYLQRIRNQSIQNFGIVLAKSLLKGVPLEWEAYQDKVGYSLIALRDRAPQVWPDLSTTIIRLIDNLGPVHRPRAIGFLAAQSAFWTYLQPATQIALQETANNIELVTDADFRILAGVALTPFRETLRNVIDNLDEAQLQKAVEIMALPDLWERVINSYKRAGSYRSSEDFFRRLITPFSGTLTSGQLDYLLDALMENSQCWNAGATPNLLLGLLRDAAPNNLPSNDAKNRFFRECTRKRVFEDYEEIFEHFSSNGWATPEFETSSQEE